MQYNNSCKASDDTKIYAGDMVLVRNSRNEMWKIKIFNYYNKSTIISDSLYVTGDLECYKYCIPFKKYKYLCGTDIDFTKIYTNNITFGSRVFAYTDKGERVEGVVIEIDNGFDGETYTVAYVSNTYGFNDFVSSKIKTKHVELFFLN